MYSTREYERSNNDQRTTEDSQNDQEAIQVDDARTSDDENIGEAIYRRPETVPPPNSETLNTVVSSTPLLVQIPQ